MLQVFVPGVMVMTVVVAGVVYCLPCKLTLKMGTRLKVHPE